MGFRQYAKRLTSALAWSLRQLSVAVARTDSGGMPS